MSLFNWLRRDPTAAIHEPSAELAEPALPDPDSPDDGAPVVDAVALWTAFRQNQVAAEARYLDRALDLGGEVDHVDRDHRGRIRVHLQVNPYCTLQVLYPEAARDEVAGLKPGDQVRLRARVDNVDTGYVIVAAVPR